MKEGKLSVSAQIEYLRAMQTRYREADRSAKSHLGRKYLIALMNSPHIGRQKRSRERGRIYDAEVVQAITTITDALDWICAERLQPSLYSMAQHLEACGEMTVSSEVLDKLQRISVSSVERILQTIRPAQRLPRPYPGRRSDTRAQEAVPISIIPWQQPEPGHFEVDLVHHGTPDRQGNLVCTIQFVDVLTGWGERFALMGYTFEAIWQAIQAFRGHCPIPVRERHSDAGSEFINQPLIAAFGEQLVGVAQTRGRTPLERLCEATPTIGRETRERLQLLYQQTNPMALKRNIHAQIEDLVLMTPKEETLAPV